MMSRNSRGAEGSAVFGRDGLGRARRERPEDDEVLIPAVVPVRVPAGRERPEDDEVLITRVRA